MLRWLSIIVTAGILAFGIIALVMNLFQPPNPIEVSTTASAAPTPQVANAKEQTEGGSGAPASAPRGAISFVPNYLPIHECMLTYIRRQDAPSEREGILLYVATDELDGNTPGMSKDDDIVVNERYAYREIRAGESPKESEILRENGKVYVRLHPDDLVDSTKVIIRERPRKLRRLRENMEVKEGQLLALVNPALAADEFDVRLSTVDSNKADQQASLKTRDETEQRWITAKKMNSRAPNVVSSEEERGAQLTYLRYKFEEVGKQMAIKKSESELKQALTTLKMHEIRSVLNGVVKTIDKQRGEAVKNQDRVVQIQQVDRVRVQGTVEVQYINQMKQGDTIKVEPSSPEPPQVVLSGHTHEVRAVAVSMKRNIVSASDDKNVFVWIPEGGSFKGNYKTLPHNAEVRAIACSPREHVAVSGDATGNGHVWDLDTGSLKFSLEGGHNRAINYVTYGPNGNLIVTGGADSTLVVWNAADGKLIQRLTGHRGEVTSVQFLSPTEIVSSGTDKHIIVYNLQGDKWEKGQEVMRPLGEVAVLGVNADPKNKQALYDQGNRIYIVNLPSREFVGELVNPSAGNNFNTMALFSPDGKLILTHSDACLQLWRAPLNGSRPYELRQLVWTGGQTTCGSFAPLSTNPAENFVVTGTKEGQVVVWSVPTPEEINSELTATITLLEPALDSASRGIRIQAELDNPKMADGRRRLLLGMPVNMVYYPNKK